MSEDDQHDAKCESEFIIEAGMWTGCDCTNRRKPCRGVNANICVGEGCYGEVCPTLQRGQEDNATVGGFYV